MENMYPGAEVKFYPWIKNTGSVPSTPTGFEVQKISGSPTLYDNIEVLADCRQYDKNNVMGPVVLWNTGWISIADLQDALNDGLTYKTGENAGEPVVLNPGDTLRFDAWTDENGEENNCLWFRINEDAGNDTQGKDVKFKIDFDFTQAVP